MTHNQELENEAGSTFDAHVDKSMTPEQPNTPEQAAEEYAKAHKKIVEGHWWSNEVELKKAFKAGAEWQSGQVELDRKVNSADIDSYLKKMKVGADTKITLALLIELLYGFKNL